MTKKIIIFLLLFCCSTLMWSQQNIENKVHKHILVKGDCSMCKSRIEESVTIENTSMGIYNIETQVLDIEYDSKKTTLDNLMKKLAAVGHDNELYKAEDKAYNELPDCCHYDRNIPLGTVEEHDQHEEELNEVIVKKELRDTSISKKSTELTYNINKKELLRAACCNLAESFETNATVDVSFTNAVLGTQQIKMLGLDQKYTLLSKEIMPDFRGLAVTGLNFIPGKWIESIQLTKGASTVVNGYEAITGQINTQILKYNQDREETAINLYANNNSRAEGNFTYISKLSEDWGNAILFHTSGLFEKQDQNHDLFLDAPLYKQYNFMDLLNFSNEKGFEAIASIHLLSDQKTAGSIHFDEREHRLGNTYYGSDIKTQRAQLSLKTGYVFPNKPHQSMGWQNQATYHHQDSYFGQHIYDGIQKSFYSNFIFESRFTENHKYKIGASFSHDQFHEQYNEKYFNRNENVLGAFAEYTYNNKNITLVSGMRLDYHNTIGTHFIPRINVKYDILPKTILRASIGKGLRIASVLAENQQYFVSQREALFTTENPKYAYGLEPEIAWNYGMSLQQEFVLFKTKNTLIADFFRTDFQNQVIVDVENPRYIQFYNLQGKSYANSLQIQWDFIPSIQWETRVAFKYYDVKSTFSNKEIQVPFMPKHRAFVTVNYKTKENKNKGFWDSNFTLQYVGKQRIPSTKINSLVNQRPSYSQDYIVMNVQIAKYFNKNIRIYLGVENVGNYVQYNPILSADNPFSEEFDASLVYAPTMGSNYYIGIDFKF